MRIAFDDAYDLKRRLKNLKYNNSLKPTIKQFVSFDENDTLLEHLNKMIDKYENLFALKLILIYDCPFFYPKACLNTILRNGARPKSYF